MNQRTAFFLVCMGAVTWLGMPSLARADHHGVISGVVTNSKTSQSIASALVILQCTCLPEVREAQTNSNGLYRFAELPPGQYTIQVLSGRADVSKVVGLQSDRKFRANFQVNPDNEFLRFIRVGGSTSAQSHIVKRSEPKPPEPSHRERLVEHRQDILAQRAEASAASDPATPVTPTVSAPALALDAEPAVEQLSKDYARRVVYTGTMTLAVFETDAAKSEIEALVVAAGGYVQVMRAEMIVVRIPSDQFRESSSTIGGLGRVDDQSMEALDVTEDFYDLQTRIRVLRKTEEQLLELLSKARTVKDALAVRAALDEVTLELESALGKQRLLVSRVSYSALTITLTRRSKTHDGPITNDPFPWVDDIGAEGTAWK